MDSWSTYLALTGGRTTALVQSAEPSPRERHLADLRARRGAGAVRPERWWQRWRRPTGNLRPAAA